MLNSLDQRPAARAARNVPKQDLRAWLALMQEAGELVTVTGAGRDEEIGGIVDIYQRTMGAPGGNVRRDSRFSAAPPGGGEYSHLGAAYQSYARPAGGNRARWNSCATGATT